VFSSHDGRCDGWDDDVDEVLVRADDGGRGVAIVVSSFVVFLVRCGVVELLRVGGEGSKSDGHAGGLEVGRVEGHDANDILVVWLQVFYGHGGLLRRNIADYMLCERTWWERRWERRGVKRTVNAIDAYDIFHNGSALVWGLPVQQDTIGLDAGKRNEGRDGDLETQQIDEFFDGLGEDLVSSECNPVQTYKLATAGRCVGVWDVGMCGYGPYQKRAESTQAVLSHPEERKTRPSML
jgi:hypothetical protein